MANENAWRRCRVERLRTCPFLVDLGWCRGRGPHYFTGELVGTAAALAKGLGDPLAEYRLSEQFAQPDNDQVPWLVHWCVEGRILQSVEVVERMAEGPVLRLGFGFILLDYFPERPLLFLGREQEVAMAGFAELAEVERRVFAHFVKNPRMLRNPDVGVLPHDR